jgi:hypothetical protein
MQAKVTAQVDHWYDGMLGEMLAYEIRVAFSGKIWLRTEQGRWVRDCDAESVAMLVDWFEKAAE